MSVTVVAEKDVAESKDDSRGDASLDGSHLLGELAVHIAAKKCLLQQISKHGKNQDRRNVLQWNWAAPRFDGRVLVGRYERSNHDKCPANAPN